MHFTHTHMRATRAAGAQPQAPNALGPLQEITTSRYAPNMVFEDPISKYNNRDGYIVSGLDGEAGKCGLSVHGGWGVVAGWGGGGDRGPGSTPWQLVTTPQIL